MDGEIFRDQFSQIFLTKLEVVKLGEVVGEEYPHIHSLLHSWKVGVASDYDDV